MFVLLFRFCSKVSCYFYVCKILKNEVYGNITSYAIGFAGPMRSPTALNSIDKNQNIAWNNGTYSLITETYSNGIASNVQDKKFW